VLLGNHTKVILLLMMLFSVQIVSPTPAEYSLPLFRAMMGSLHAGQVDSVYQTIFVVMAQMIVKMVQMK
jgi:hypothetical protein